MLLLSPSLSEEDASSHIEAIKKEHINSSGGSVSFEDFWGRKNLAYPIKKETAAIYTVLHFTLGADKLKALDEELRLDNNVIRHLVTIVPTNVEPMTLEQITAWNIENLPEKQRSKKNEEKRAPRGKKHVDTRPEMQKVDTEEAPKAEKTAEKKEKKKEDDAIDKSRLDAELNQMLEDI